MNARGINNALDFGDPTWKVGKEGLETLHSDLERCSQLYSILGKEGLETLHSDLERCIKL